MQLKKIYKACKTVGSTNYCDLTKASQLKQYAKVPKLLINVMPCLEDGDQSLSLASKDLEPDENVFDSESGSDLE